MTIDTREPLMILDSGWWPNNAYGLIKKDIFDAFVKDSWTIAIKCKINYVRENKVGIFYRKGKNTGLFYLPNGFLHLQFWTSDMLSVKYVDAMYEMKIHEKQGTNLYTIQHDKENKIFRVFINEVEVITKHYEGEFYHYKPESKYFGIGMQMKMENVDEIVEDTMDIDNFIFYSKIMDQQEVITFLDTDKLCLTYDKYGREVFDKPNKDVVCYHNFKNTTDYKIWDLTQNNIFILKYFPQSKIALFE